MRSNPEGRGQTGRAPPAAGLDNGHPDSGENHESMAVIQGGLTAPFMRHILQRLNGHHILRRGQPQSIEPGMSHGLE